MTYGTIFSLTGYYCKDITYSFNLKKVMTTDDGFCCVFNAIEQTSLLKTDIIEPVRYGMKHTKLYKYYRI